MGERAENTNFGPLNAKTDHNRRIGLAERQYPTDIAYSRSAKGKAKQKCDQEIHPETHLIVTPFC